MADIKNNTQSYIRDIVGKYMTTLGEKDERVVVVNADLMKTCRNAEFVEKFPNRSFNVGIAEQNLVSFSAGLAHEGFLPYAFSMAPFISMRACEQCRTDVAYGNLDVRLVGAYSGVSGGISGATHWGMEDCAIFMSMPNMIIMEPSDSELAKSILELSLVEKGPMYIRVTVEPTDDIYNVNIKSCIGGSIDAKSGDDGAFLCSGVTVSKAIRAANEIEKEVGKHIRVVDMYSIKPIDEKAVLSAAKTGRIVVAQDHFKIGGLASSITDFLIQLGFDGKYKSLGIDDEFCTMAHAPALYKHFSLDVDGLKGAMMELLNE